MKKDLNLLLDVFKTIRNNQFDWNEKPHLISTDEDMSHIFLTSQHRTMSGTATEEYLYAAMALDISYYFEVLEGQLRIVFY